MCGEQHAMSLYTGWYQGSPPRVRGTAHVGVNILPACGITPACAGNRNCFSFFPLAFGDHPRVCGEQFKGTIHIRKNIGSPPRVRGTVPEVFPKSSRSRITPACAGNRNQGNFSKNRHQDHPRVCGEQSSPSMIMMLSWGSPPRVRGTVENSCG